LSLLAVEAAASQQDRQTQHTTTTTTTHCHSIPQQHTTHTCPHRQSITDARLYSA
jgi:hypothetical protein